VSYRVEDRHLFSHGHIEMREYLWSRPVEAVMTAEPGVVSINMALTPRPTHTRIARLGEGRQEPEDIGRILVLMPGSSFHLSAPTGSVRSVQCELELCRFEELLGERPKWADHGGSFELGGSGSDIEWLLNRMYQELRQQVFGFDRAIEAYAEALCVELARRLHSAPPLRPDVHKGGLASWRMKLLRERVMAEAPAPRLEELADLVGMTVRQLGRAFKAETGMTLGRFIDGVTMERAHRLLATTQLSLAEIAAELGFSGATSFAQAFRRSQGLTPGAIRQLAP
jgi:AraC family transcriptional regulator